MTKDVSQGYESVAQDYIKVRSNSGQALIQTWAETFPESANILDVGAGNGKPLTSVLIKAGLKVRAIDASASMVAAFKRNFPNIEIICESALTSSFFDRKFDGILAVGLVFLFAREEQIELISRMADALAPNGRLLFSAPWQTGDWKDLLTDQTSYSLGRDTYNQILIDCGLTVLDEHFDESKNHYYEAIRKL